MTFAEIDRQIDSNNRTTKARAREQASYDYVLADLIGRSIARVYSSSARMPTIAEAYPTLFDNAEIQAKKAELSAMRFRQFANSFNSRYKGE